MYVICKNQVMVRSFINGIWDIDLNQTLAIAFPNPMSTSKIKNSKCQFPIYRFDYVVLHEGQ